MKNRKREICTSGSVRDEDGQPPRLLGRRQFLHLAAGGGELRGRTMRQLTTIAALVVALVTPAAAQSRLVVLDRPTLACSDQQALETALTLALLHDGPAFRDHASSYGCMWIEPDDGPLAVVGGSAWGNVQVMVPGAGLFWIRR